MLIIEGSMPSYAEEIKIKILVMAKGYIYICMNESFLKLPFMFLPHFPLSMALVG